MDQRVLVVDDDLLIREMTSDALVSEGFRVSTAASGPEALDLLQREGAVDVVITDLSMREMDGLQLTARIKRDHPKTDIIVLTAYASLESALQAMRLGAADYLRKPASPPEIVYGVKRAILRRQLVAENESLRDCVQAFEASRVLTSCLESSDVLPLAGEILLQVVDRQRAVGLLVHASGRPGEGIWLQGFPDDVARDIRQEIERGKLFDPMAPDSFDEAGGRTLQEGLARLGLEDEHLLTLPMRLEGKLVGAVWVFSEGRRLQPDEVRSAELVVAQSELALVNAERFLQAREKAFIDDVTDLYNARYLLAALDREVSRADRSDLSLSVLFLDLDRFKDVNDSHGHLVGSRVLKELGQLLADSIRSIDTVGRYGGDEFTILLVDTGHEKALQVADRIRESVAAARFGGGRGLHLALTVSIGVSTFPQHGKEREPLLDQADKAMYLGKALGRNHVCSSDELAASSTNRL